MVQGKSGRGRRQKERDADVVFMTQCFKFFSIIAVKSHGTKCVCQGCKGGANLIHILFKLMKESFGIVYITVSVLEDND